MGRSNIFEILDANFDINFEIRSINALYKQVRIYTSDNMEKGYGIEAYFDKFCLPFWKSRGYVTSCAEMKTRLGLTDFGITYKLDAQYTLAFLEYELNIIELCNRDRKNRKRWSREYYILLENIMKLVNYLNYEVKVIESEEKIILVEKNAAATAVAEIMDSKTAYSVIEYNHYLLKGNLDEKKQVLKALGDKFEGIKPQLKSINKSLGSDIGFLLNKLNIRHNNLEGANAEKFVRNMPKEELEQWYDDTYQLLLLAFLEVDNVQRRQKVSALQQSYDGKGKD